MQNEAFFIVVRIFKRVDGKFSDNERAIVKTVSKREPGRACKFTSDGVTYYGDVIECVSVYDSDAICKMLASLSGMHVLIYFADCVSGSNLGSE